jgi:hypothetical protein
MTRHKNNLAMLIEHVRKKGCDVDVTRGGRCAIRCPNGQVIFAANSSGDWRAVYNLRAALRRAGVVIDKGLS